MKDTKIRESAQDTQYPTNSSRNIENRKEDII